MSVASDDAAWTDRLAARSPAVQRSRSRSVQQARVLVDAARRLITERGENFTTHELVKEAGVALQTFYRYFGGKDELLLAVMEDIMREASEGFAARAAGLTSPVERLRSHVTAVIEAIDTDASRRSGRFIASEHWRLAQLYPEEIIRAIQPFADLLEVEIVAAIDEGQLRAHDPPRDAWLLMQLLLSVFHHHSFTGARDPGLADEVWRFALGALGGDADARPPRARPRRSPK